MEEDITLVNIVFDDPAKREISEYTVVMASGGQDASQCNISPVLFMTVGGEPMSFYLRPGSIKQELYPLIKAGGGIMCQVQRPGSILLIDPDEINTLSESTSYRYVSIQYIHDCVERAEQLNLDDYRINTKTVSMCSNKSPSISTGRQTYTSAENAAILKYISRRKSEIKGNCMWQQMEKEHITSHSWQSMKFHYKHLKMKQSKDVEEAGGDAEEVGGDAEEAGGDAEEAGGDAEEAGGDAEEAGGDAEAAGADADAAGADADAAGADADAASADAEAAGADADAAGADAEAAGSEGRVAGGDCGEAQVAVRHSGDSGEAQAPGRDSGEAQAVSGDSGEAQAPGRDSREAQADVREAQAAGGDNGEAQAAGGDNGEAQAAGGDNGEAQAAGGDNGEAQAAGGDNGEAQAAGGDNGEAQAAGGDNGEAQAAGGDSGETEDNEVAELDSPSCDEDSASLQTHTQPKIPPQTNSADDLTLIDLLFAAEKGPSDVQVPSLVQQDKILILQKKKNTQETIAKDQMCESSIGKNTVLETDEAQVNTSPQTEKAPENADPTGLECKSDGTHGLLMDSDEGDKEPYTRKLRSSSVATQVRPGPSLRTSKRTWSAQLSIQEKNKEEPPTKRAKEKRSAQNKEAAVPEDADEQPATPIAGPSHIDQQSPSKPRKRKRMTHIDDVLIDSCVPSESESDEDIFHTPREAQTSYLRPSSTIRWQSTDEFGGDQILLDEDVQCIRHLMKQTNQDLISVTKALLKTSGDLAAASCLLSHPRSFIALYWDPRDDDILLSANRASVKQLVEIHDHVDVCKQMVSLNVER
ncbi:uncharacterized protein LOC144203500 isoform X2 [Stigmatopora nigra]